MMSEIKIIKYNNNFRDNILRLWNDSGIRQGFVPAEVGYLDTNLLKHPAFCQDHAFVLIGSDQVQGFICGCVGDELVRGKERGYFTCLLLSGQAENKQNAFELLDVLEKSFRRAGRQYSVCTFFNPIQISWIIPDTAGHRHNNTPGIATDLPLHNWLVEYGYQIAAQECAMHLKLAGFTVPGWVSEKAERAEQSGYRVEWYDREKHTGLRTMVESVGNPMWNAQIPVMAEEINMIVALKGNEVVGFTGPVYPEENGRGYFAGIAVSPEHKKKGLGTLLFYRLCQEEKNAGAVYLSLFTGCDNPAINIYRNAGFEEKRIFSVMLKAL